MSAADVKAAAHGQWPQILAAFGVEESYLQNRHGPCPACGGKDRYRYDDKGDGRYYCNACGAGDGFSLLGIVNDWDMSRAFREVAEFLRVPKTDTPKTDDKANRRTWLRRIWGECSSDDKPLRDYLAGRGLPMCPALGYHPGLSYFVDGECAGKVPAMLAVVRGKDGSAQGLHRTYLGDVRVRKKLTPAVSTYTGGAIQLMGAGETLAIAEGIETALAVHQITAAKGDPVPVWAAGNTTLLRQFVPPKGIKRVLVCGDCDDNFAGQAAAYELAHRLMTKHNVIAEIRIPPSGDWADWWERKA